MVGESSGREGGGTPEVLGWIEKGETLIGEKRFDEAVMCCDCALKLEPGNRQAWFVRGRALSGAAREQEALACFDKALAIDPEYLLAWAGKARTLRSLGKGGEAAVCLRNWRRLSGK
jgi:tetratricopeptide (TPR) repeat protein